MIAILGLVIGVVLGILVWQEGGEAVGALLAVGAVAQALLAWWLSRRKRAGREPRLAGPDRSSASEKRGSSCRVSREAPSGPNAELGC